MSKDWNETEIQKASEFMKSMGHMSYDEFCESVEMQSTKTDELKKGDIVINGWAGDQNPCKCLLYLEKSSVKQGRYTIKTYKCLAYDGRIVHTCREDARIEKIGHMAEFDAFILALKGLKNEQKHNST